MKRIALMAQMNNAGVGIQTWEFAKHIKPNKVLITDLTVFHEAAGKKVVNYPSRFSGSETRITNGLPNFEDIEWLTEDIDTVFFVETFLSWELLSYAKRRCHVIGQLNYELVDRLHPSYQHYEMPQEMWFPSLWHYPEMTDYAQQWGCTIRHVPVPVNRQLIPFRPRTKAKTFLHVAGHDTYEDRNGTELVRAAIPLVKTHNVRFLIRSQHQIPPIEDERVRMNTKEVREYHDIYNGDFDVLLLPRRYGGLSLQRDEALSSGAPVIMLDIPPQTGTIPEEWLVEPKFQKQIRTRPQIDIYDCEPKDLAAKIDYVAALSEFTFANWSMKADMLARNIDWRVMAPIYRALLDGEPAPEPKVFEEEFFWS